MKIKWNWGTKLVIWITAFIVFMLTLVFISFNYDIGLVEKDYYPKGLAYQDRINAIENAKNINAIFNITQDKDYIKIQIPELQIEQGTITLFRPSDNSYDRIFDMISSDNELIIIPKTETILGKYIIKINWKYKDKEYYVEQLLYVK